MLSIRVTRATATISVLFLLSWLAAGNAASTQNIEQVQAPDMWADSLDGTGYSIAIIDRGVNSSITALSGKIIAEACFADDSSDNGTVGYCPNNLNTQTGTGSAAPCGSSNCDHGSHVAGIAASAASSGVNYGVAPGASIVAVRVASNTGNILAADRNKALEWLYNNRASFDPPLAAVNISLGSSYDLSNNYCDSSQATAKAWIDGFLAVGIPVIVAAGNDNKIGSSSTPGAMLAPACISTAISVGGTEQGPSYGQTEVWWDGIYPEGSNRQPETSLVAPANSIYAPYTSPATIVGSGTSFAAPHVAGAWALLKQAYPSAPVDRIRRALHDTGASISENSVSPAFSLSSIRIHDALVYMDAESAPAISSFTASPTTIYATPPQNVTLSWTTTNAVGCSIDHGVGSVGLNTNTVVSVSATITYRLTCTRSGFSDATYDRTITVDPAQTIGSFTASPSTVYSDSDQITLSWASTNATSCYIDNDVGTDVGTVAASGPTTTTISTTTAFTLRCSRAGHSDVTFTPSRTVTRDPDPVITSLTVSNDVLFSVTGTTTLSWSSTNTTSCSIDNGIGSVSTNGSTVALVNGTTTFTLTCVRSGHPDATEAVIVNQSPQSYIATADRSNCKLLQNGTVKCWGVNSFGQLGIGNTVQIGDGSGEMGTSLLAANLGTGRTAKAVTGRSNFYCALLDNSKVKCWGQNTSGQLGQGNATNKGDGSGEMGDNLAYTDLGTGRTAKFVVSGYNHSCAVLDNDTLKCWGANGSGQLGIESSANMGNNSGEMGDSLPAVNVGTGRTVRKLALGETHTCVLLDNGTVKCWGNYLSDRLGWGSPSSNKGDGAGEMGDNLPALNLGTGRTAIAIAAGTAHTCVILDNNSMKCWGNNQYGALGIGNTTDHGNSSNMGDNLPAVNLGTSRTSKAISAGNQMSCALLDNETVKCWGKNTDGYLGQGDTSSRGDSANELGDNLAAISLGFGGASLSVSAGDSHVCALIKNQKFKCWGNGANGALGLGSTADKGDGANEMGDYLPYVDVGEQRIKISGGTQTCIRTDNGKYKCWGYNEFGSLGEGNTNNRGDNSGEMGNSIPELNLNGEAILDIASGPYGVHNCAVVNDNQVKKLNCWGSNSYGELGLGHTANEGDNSNEMGASLAYVSLNSTAIISVAIGDQHSCSIYGSTGLKCWGDNEVGQLGLGDILNRGDGTNEMGSNLPAIVLYSNTLFSIKKVALGTLHTCAIRDDDTVKCWGWNSSGQLGLGDTSNRGDNSGEMGGNLPVVNLVSSGGSAKDIIAFGSSTCALLSNNTVKCWGDNQYSQLGNGNSNNIGDGANEMGNNLAVSASNVLQMSPSGLGVCVITSDYELKCWGSNFYGEAGQGDSNSYSTAQTVDLGTNRYPLYLSGNCVLLDDNGVKCWGNNSYGQLGLGDTNNRGDEANEMGDYLPEIDTGECVLDGNFCR